MVTNNKVLTVSYGTFSCTLEGFDNSFDTMKAIAEYFRDLAADDRYFGAEPPTPDAEMLARIAEREIERRVSARMTDGGGIYLSAAGQEAKAEAAEDMAEAEEEIVETPVEAEAPEEAPEAEVEVEVEDVTDQILTAVQAETEAETAEAVADTAEEVIEDVVADLAADESSDDSSAEEIPQEIEEIAEAPIEAPIIEEIAKVAALDEIVAEEEIAQIEEEHVAEDFADEAEAPLAEFEEETAEDDDAVTFAEAEIVDPEDSFEAEDDSIAAKLQRIRAVVSKSAQEPEEEDFSEDEHADSFLAETRREIETVLKLDDDMAAAAAAEDAESVAEEIEETPQPIKPVRARVLRMKKSDFEAAVSDGLLEAEPDEDEDEIVAASPEMPASSLSAEDEAELLAELAQVEAELNRGDAKEAQKEVEEGLAGAEQDAPVAPKRPKALTDTSDDMSRLLREANTQMEEPEGNRRRQAIAHLRAAVAATKAEKKAGNAKPGADQTEAYREDLASVVRTAPQRPEPRSEAPARPAPAPLKLVAEQRIDTPAQDTAPAAEETPRAPVRPRRISAADRTEAAAQSQTPPVGEAAADATNFAEFAEAMGATQLPDLLEAAAAYLTYVEGRGQFSRPMVMRMARDMDEENFSREDTLRTFGQLLRDKKIAKIGGGRFTASENIAYKPEDRAAG
ncbi:MAG: hypothetical protein GYB25_02540 [Rhodobacteraceae bacterium]|nr:hypothetical protein [Paracoccaceae bacterium]